MMSVRRFLAVLGWLCVAVGVTQPAQSQNLSVAQVQQVIAQAVEEARVRGVNATIAVVDRVGNVLGVFQMNGAPARVTVTSNRGIARGNGLEQVQDTFAALGAAASPSSALAAIAKAVTGAYLSSSGNAFTTRTASQIVQEHFNPGEFFSPSGPLFGVQFSQLPCSDFSVRQATNAAFTGEVSATVGPKRSPLGMSADPGGLPLYINGSVVGAVGIESDGVYTLDLAITDFDSDPDEIIALAGQSGFAPPADIQGHRIFVEGKSLRYTDAKVSALQSNPAAAPAFGTINGVLGNLVNVRGYTAAAAITAGQTYGAIASGVAPDNGGIYNFVGQTVFVFFNNAGNRRFDPANSSFPTVANGGLTAAEVTTIIGNALKVAFAARAQIRRPLGSSHAQVTISVVDVDGNILGMARTPDAPIFGSDVSLQKARTAAFFSSTTAAAYLGTYNSSGLSFVAAAGNNANGVSIATFLTAVQNFVGATALADGIAFADRSGGNLSRPFYPDGINGRAPGPFSRPFDVWSPFNTGLQLDVVLDNVAQHVVFSDVNGADGDTNATCTFFNASGTGGGTLTRLGNGFQIFPGSVPIYRNGTLIGGIGVSGDGIDQDDMISFRGLFDAGLALGNGVGNAPLNRRADSLTPQGVRLRYVNCPYKPFLGSSVRNACHGK